MEELKKKIEETSELKATLCDWAKQEMSKGMTAACTHELGEVIDMIKDLAEAEKELAECCYYKSIVNAMHEAQEEEELMARMGGGMGYNHNRYANGRFATKGHGNYTHGFHPSEREMDMMPPYMMKDAMGMGYDHEDPHTTHTTHQGGTHGYHGGVEEQVTAMHEMYKNADSEQERRHIKEEITRLANEMR